jgi:hypothetical protein
MLRNVCLKLVKVAAVVICIGTATSACWDHERDGRDGGRYGDHGVCPARTPFSTGLAA